MTQLDVLCTVDGLPDEIRVPGNLQLSTQRTYRELNYQSGTLICFESCKKTYHSILSA